MREIEGARASEVFRFADKRLALELAGIPAVLIRNWVTGRVVLVVDDRIVEVRERLPVGTPIYLGPRHASWNGLIRGHDVRFEYERKRSFPDLRATVYRVYVDGTLTWERRLRW
jgi:hypothetical protein